MNPIVGNIKIRKTARYFTNKVDLQKVENIWFLLHGYGQLAQNFIKKFELLDNGKNYLVAPEALSRFYLDNGFGKIGASWMTKEDRENEIEDYADYLTDVYKSINNELEGKEVRLNVFAFSQGTSTACRWLQKGDIKADNLILWGSFFPADFNLADWENAFNKLLVVTGTEDRFFPPASLEEGKKLLDKYLVRYSAHLYKGIHEINVIGLNEVLANL